MTETVIWLSNSPSSLSPPSKRLIEMLRIPKLKNYGNSELDVKEGGGSSESFDEEN